MWSARSASTLSESPVPCAGTLWVLAQFIRWCGLLSKEYVALCSLWSSFVAQPGRAIDRFCETAEGWGRFRLTKARSFVAYKLWFGCFRSTAGFGRSFTVERLFESLKGSSASLPANGNELILPTTCYLAFSPIYEALNQSYETLREKFISEQALFARQICFLI